MGGGWNNTGVVAFLYINNCRTFPVGLEELSRKSESLKIRRRENPGRGRVGSGGFGPGSRAAGGLGCGACAGRDGVGAPLRGRLVSDPNDGGALVRGQARRGLRKGRIVSANLSESSGTAVSPSQRAPSHPSSGPSTSHGSRCPIAFPAVFLAGTSFLPAATATVPARTMSGQSPGV